MKYILTGQEMSAADRATSLKIGIPSIVLMERAALSVADEITCRADRSQKVLILSGPGNNGADGIAAGRILSDRGYTVRFMLISGKAPSEDSSMYVQQKILGAYGIVPGTFDAEGLRQFAPDVIVDAMFGTGLARDLAGNARAAVECVNEYCRSNRCTVLGLDIPSGISSEDGRVMGCAVRCDLTVTFAYYKRGHFLYPGSTYCGEKVLRQIGITDLSFDREGERRPLMYIQEASDIAGLLPARDESGNKGTFGKILIIAGSTGMCGAALLCASAALRSGAGMVRIFTAEPNRVIVQTALPEALLTTYDEGASDDRIRELLRRGLSWADTVAIGPGIGRSDRAAAMLRALLEMTCVCGGLKESCGCKGVVIDADALRLIAADKSLADLIKNRGEEISCILTPHLAEFADLMHVSVREAAEDREALLHSLSNDLHCAVIGKDARTMVAGAGNHQICLITNGNCGMATAGSGDVLTGITASLLCRMATDRGEPEKDQFLAAQAAAYIHAAAGDRAKDSLGEDGMIASDIAAQVGDVIRELRKAAQ